MNTNSSTHNIIPTFISPSIIEIAIALLILLQPNAYFFFGITMVADSFDTVQWTFIEKRAPNCAGLNLLKSISDDLNKNYFSMSLSHVLQTLIL